MANAATINIARDIRNSLAGKALTARQAKLYSQRLRLDMGREGLSSFESSDIDNYLDEAMLLLQCGLLERRVDPNSDWRNGIKRAAEIIEWLSQYRLKPKEAPLHLLAAAAYQIADYPALANGHLRRVPVDEPFSIILRELLRADFPATITAVIDFWRDQRVLKLADRIEQADLTAYTLQHVVMCIGTVCAYLRTGRIGMTEKALIKLEKLAASFLHSHDNYSYILAQLIAASCRRFAETCIWPQLDFLSVNSTAATRAALVQYARSSFINKRVLVWPAQVAGIVRLRENSSFVLCTPTGSGKTTVATLAIVQSLFAELSVDSSESGNHGQSNLILYLVPSRALAAEVERRLAQDLKAIAAEHIVVTGLYGGVDWGPTDTWMQTDQPTVVICTFEKADALLRYLGILFLSRVRLIVIDEVHMVEQDRARISGQKIGSSRPLRLEQLGARLLRVQGDYHFRILALSAVAARSAPALARWINSSHDATPASSSYRSTRQMLGRLEVNERGQFAIRYNLMDSCSLKFEDERRDDTPYVPNPFPPIPGGISEDAGPEVAMRAPTLWAALHLAAERPDGSTPSVMISLTQRIDSFSSTCIDLLERWSETALPRFQSIDMSNDLWIRCLASAADYFSTQSIEYRLLSRGIAVHHGKMPGLLARRLKILIDRGLVRVIIATSTLTEGVNLPVNFLLIPSLYRDQNVLTLHEFTNLIGRAGRPGVATEGSALVVLPERTITLDRYGRRRITFSRQWNGYEKLVEEIEVATTVDREGAPADEASSPLTHLLEAIEETWNDLTGGGTQEEFTTWLEQTAVANTDEEAGLAYSYLDSLDAFLIAAIQEVEEIKHMELTPDQIEEELTTIWRRTYAFAAAQEEDRKAEIWLARGRAIKTLYSDAAQRRRIYKTSLSPRSATRLIELAETIRSAFQGGVDYSRWLPEQRFIFIRDIINLLSQVPSFQITTTLGRRKNYTDWPRQLRWWLSKDTLQTQPAPTEITNWYEFVSQNFIYRSTWGIGSIIGLLIDTNGEEEPIRALEIGDWPRSGLPWIAFWVKELITWGTLEPVAAFLLARMDAIDRPHAEAEAKVYYESLPAGMDANDVLDPRVIRDWVGTRRVQAGVPSTSEILSITVTLERPVEVYLNSHLSVFPIETENNLVWIDPAGYIVARCEIPDAWPDDHMSFDFEMDVLHEIIVGNPYQIQME